MSARILEGKSHVTRKTEAAFSDGALSANEHRKVFRSTHCINDGKHIVSNQQEKELYVPLTNIVVLTG